ncbi:TetR/AcrR family transcriptional regulator [Novosphingobium sp. YJ-S2-02]|uniref:TetR/AcrR family transcriptional regulator n=1 Tax=Novosphingobium aureum TaxID=2792964 RepID=A0A931HAW3_9SPHN|nr:TetR/AcrR family transcriptional regulator [Novosphingobium aureum]MBH0112399.1 TetR/AcrR family transcriptional regulator [Novosphingobium aureum]
MEENLGKRELNRLRKRATIVSAARESFLQQGYAATSMSAIADELRCSKATMWSHFASKEELFIAVVDELVAEFSRDIDEVLTSQTFSATTLRRAALRFLNCLMREPSIMLFRLVLSEGERFPEIADAFYQRGPARVRKGIRTFFATRFTEADSETLTRVIISALTGYRSDMLLRPVRPSEVDREIFVDELVAMIDWPDPRPGASVTPTT